MFKSPRGCKRSWARDDMSTSVMKTIFPAFSLVKVKALMFQSKEIPREGVKEVV